MSLEMIEAKALRFNELNEIIRRAKEEKEMIKNTLSQLMKEAMMSTYRVTLDEIHDVKISVETKEKKYFDHEQMAEDLNISVSATKNKEVLIDLAEKGLLTRDTYRKYTYYSPEEVVSIRKVKA